MSSFNPRIFSSPYQLKTIAPKHLLAFFTPWRVYFSDRGLVLPEDPEIGIPYEELSAILMNPIEGVPEDMVNALYYVHETAWNESMDDLLDRFRKAGFDVEKDDATSAADLAVQVWLKAPLVLQRHHAEAVAFSRSNFMYFAGRGGARAAAPDVSQTQMLDMQSRMDEWFDLHRRGRGCRIFVFASSLRQRSRGTSSFWTKLITLGEAVRVRHVKAVPTGCSLLCGGCVRERPGWCCSLLPRCRSILSNSMTC